MRGSVNKMLTCVKGKKLEVLKSNAGYYIGTLEDGCPNCRVSERYYQTDTAGQFVLTHKAFNPRICLENVYCSKGNCIP